MTEKSAKGVRGFLLYSPISKDYFFRVYDKVNKSNFVDYKLSAEDIEIEIVSKWNALVTKEGKQCLDYSSEALGKSNGHIQ